MNYKDMRFHYHFFHVIVRPLFKALFKFEVFGYENMPTSGSVLLMMNHASYFDPIFIGAAVKRNLHYMARSTLFKPGFIRWFLLNMNAFPVNLGSPDRLAIKKALKILDEGKVLLIFPEGTRTIDGNLQKAQDGVGFIAYRTKARVIPVYLDGTRKVLPRGAKIPKTGKITVSFGKPIDMDYFRKKEPSRETYSQIGEEIMFRIKELMYERHPQIKVNVNKDKK